MVRLKISEVENASMNRVYLVYVGELEDDVRGKYGSPGEPLGTLHFGDDDSREILSARTPELNSSSLFLPGDFTSSNEAVMDCPTSYAEALVEAFNEWAEDYDGEDTNVILGITGSPKRRRSVFL